MSCTAENEVQTEEQEPVPICSDNFVWCKSCEAKQTALYAAEARLSQSISDLSACQAAVEGLQRQEAVQLNAKRALVLQVEQLQNLLLIESGRAAEIQNTLDTKLSAAAAEINTAAATTTSEEHGSPASATPRTDALLRT